MCVQGILSVEKDLIEAILSYCILNVLSTFAIKLFLRRCHKAIGLPFLMVILPVRYQLFC